MEFNKWELDIMQKFVTNQLLKSLKPETIQKLQKFLWKINTNLDLAKAVAQENMLNSGNKKGFQEEEYNG